MSNMFRFVRQPSPVGAGPAHMHSRAVRSHEKIIFRDLS